MGSLADREIVVVGRGSNVFTGRSVWVETYTNMVYFLIKHEVWYQEKISLNFISYLHREFCLLKMNVVFYIISERFGVYVAHFRHMLYCIC